MKVGIFSPGYPQDVGGGYTFEQDILSALRKALHKSHHEFVLISYQNQLDGAGVGFPNLQTLTLERKKPVSKLSSLTNKAAIRLGLRKKVVESSLQEKVKEENIEFMWFLTPIYESVDIPYVATMFDIQHRLQPWFPEVGTNTMWNYRESYYSNHLRRATYIITPNEIGMRELALFYQITPDRFRLLPHPVPYVEAQVSSEDTLKVVEKHKIQPLYLFYPAQFWPHKNHVNLLLALQILRDQYQIDIDLVLVGADKGNMQFVQDVAEKMSLSQHVHFLGFIPRSELIALYRGAFALTYVSFFGPENLPPLEAFACGCPVIVNDVAGSKEQFDDAAIHVNARKPEEIAQAVKMLIDDPALRNSLIERGNKRATRYTSSNYIQDVFKMLDEFERVRRNWQ